MAASSSSSPSPSSAEHSQLISLRAHASSLSELMPELSQSSCLISERSEEEEGEREEEERKEEEEEGDRMCGMSG